MSKTINTLVDFKPQEAVNYPPGSLHVNNLMNYTFVWEFTPLEELRQLKWVLLLDVECVKV